VPEKTLIAMKRGLFFVWNPPLLCRFDIIITRQKFVRDLSRDGCKTFAYYRRCI